MFLGETGKEKIESGERPSWRAGEQGESYESHPCLVLGEETMTSFTFTTLLGTILGNTIYKTEDGG